MGQEWKVQEMSKCTGFISSERDCMGYLRVRWVDDIKIDLREVGCDIVK
jgi:hypothetical protein